MKQFWKKLRGKPRKKLSIGWRIAGIFAVFVAVALLMTWIFQVFLLSTFYEKAKSNELAELAEDITDYLDSDVLEMEANRVSWDSNVSVAVYRADESGLTSVVNTSNSGVPGLTFFMEEDLKDMFTLAEEGDGVASGQMRSGFSPSDEPEPISPLGEFFSEEIREKKKETTLYYAKLAYDTAGTEYMVVITSAVAPMDSTVQTLKSQYVWIAVSLLLLAILFTFILYRFISKPLSRMTLQAQELGKGNYDVHFEGEEFRETKELADTLNYSAGELSKLDALQKELIANISHDLRTPLTMMKGYAEIMRDLPGENTPENAQIIIDEVNHLSGLVSDMLDLSKIRANARSMKPEHFDLTEALTETMTRYDAFTRHQGYHITCNSGAKAFVYADKNMILQVLYNLINNAINYTGADKNITVTEIVKEDAVRVEVTDTGEGIPEDKLPMIWDRYYKVDKVHRMAMIGTGLGLSIVKAILESHKAKYGVVSTVGEGSTFWFELPIDKGNASIIGNQ